MRKLLATVMALVFGMTFGALGLVQAKDMPMEHSSSPAAEEKAMEDHGKAGEGHGKTAEDQGKAGDNETKTAEKKGKKGHAKKKKAS
ncbi:MAG: hypothetical protein AB7T38_14215 [Nitrospirales bacterium]